MNRSRGRPRGAPANHHLTLDNGVWIFRLARNGRDIRRSTGCPKSEMAPARRIRDKWLGEEESKRHGIEEIPEPKTLGEIVEMYLAAESQPYPAEERGIRRSGFKRSHQNDRLYRNRLYAAGLDRDLCAALIDEERLLDAVAARERQKAAPLTIRNDFRFLCRVFHWARSHKRKTGIVSSPFDGLDTAIRKRLFPRTVKAKLRPFRRDELIHLYPLLPSYAYRPVRFAAHTGLRKEEVFSLRWGQVNLEARTLYVSPDVAKNFKEREVPLSDVALSILRQMRPESPNPDGPVFLGPEGERLRDIRGSLGKAVRKVCPKPKPGERYPTFHSLRKTCATALESVASKAVAGMVLGHSDGDVTDLYIKPSFEDALAALNRAALLIDGEVQENVAIFRGSNAIAAEMAERMGPGRVSA